MTVGQGKKGRGKEVGNKKMGEEGQRIREGGGGRKARRERKEGGG